MSATITKDYYESYWTAEGHCPTGALSGDVRRVFERHVGRQDACLDVGCGDGRTAGLWLNTHARRYVGVDISSHAVELATQAGLEAICVGDAATLPFADDSFDVAVCLEVFEHLFDPRSVALEIARVLRPGGTLIATVPNVSHWKQRADLALRGRWNPRGDDLSVEEPWRDPHIRFFTPSSVAALLCGHGFANVAVSGRQMSVARNFPHLTRFGRTESGPIARALAQRFPDLGAGLVSVATTPAAR
jgi:SAM-dependent methyltransferase